MCEKVGFCPQEVIPPRGTSMFRLKSANSQSQVKAAGKIQRKERSGSIEQFSWVQYLDFFSLFFSHIAIEREGGPTGQTAIGPLNFYGSPIQRNARRKGERKSGCSSRSHQSLASPRLLTKWPLETRFSKENVFPVYILAGKSGKRAVVDLPPSSSFFFKRASL